MRNLLYLSLAGMLLTGCDTGKDQNTTQSTTQTQTVQATKEKQPEATPGKSTEKAPAETTLEQRLLALQQHSTNLKMDYRKIMGMREGLSNLQRSGAKEQFQQYMGQYMKMESQWQEARTKYIENLTSVLKELEALHKKNELKENELALYAFFLGEDSRFSEKLSVLKEVQKSRALSVDETVGLIKTYEQMNQLSNAVSETQKLLTRKELKEEEKLQLKMMLGQNLLFTEKFKEASAIFTEIAKDPQYAPAVKDLLDTAKEYVDLKAKEEQYRTADKNLPQAEILTSRGRIVVELFEDDAPNGVANFITLADKQFYDGQKFHRVIPKFMAQGGDPNSKDEDPSNDGTGGPGYKIKTEVSKRKHFRGVLSYANSGMDTDGSQFFITTVPTFWLNGKHAVFGRVIDGQSVVDGLQKNDAIKSIRILKKRDHKYEVKSL